MTRRERMTQHGWRVTGVCDEMVWAQQQRQEMTTVAAQADTSTDAHTTHTIHTSRASPYLNTHAHAEAAAQHTKQRIRRALLMHMSGLRLLQDEQVSACDGM